MNAKKFMLELGLERECSGICSGTGWAVGSSDESVTSFSPVDQQPLGTIQLANRNDYESVLQTAEKAWLHWRKIPAPERGLVIADIGKELRQYKNPLGELVSYEMGKSARGTR